MTGSEIRIREVFADAGLRGWLYAAPVSTAMSGTREIVVDADDTVALASVWKLPLLVAFARAVDAGVIDPCARTMLRAMDRTGGGAGIAMLQDAVTVSWRDLATSMTAMSDNAAADAIYRKLGPRRVTEAISALGLRRTTVRGDSRSELQALLTSTGTETEEAAFAVLADSDRPTDAGAYSVLVASSSTPRETSRLLRALWNDTAASAEQCSFARDILHRRVGPHRLRLGFPIDAVTIAEKSGTVGAFRHSAGVVRFPGENAFVVTVFTRAARSDRNLPGAEAAIGAAAKIAIDSLRAAPRTS